MAKRTTGATAGRPRAVKMPAPGETPKLFRALDALVAYNEKRNFAKTSEPKGKLQKGGGDRFCVQKHDATRLHYDLRLEMHGVLKSWAVTPGPSLVPGEKRLSVHTEDTRWNT